MSSTIARGGTIKRDAAEPVRAERFTADATPQQLAEQLTRLQAAVVEATEAARRNRGNSKIAFEDLACGTGGALVGPLRHGLGRRARWRVVDWARSTPGGSHGLERAGSAVAGAINDDNNITLRSYVAGTASIEVE